MLDWLLKPKGPTKIPQHLSLEQLRALGKESDRYIEVFYGDGTVLRIWEPGKTPGKTDDWKYY